MAKATRIVRAYSLAHDRYHEYELPSQAEAIAHINATWGKEYDRFERRMVEGGLPNVVIRRTVEIAP